eukprot:CAMPEP_0184644074 /NCGR_PEP_ID=MMETSP0308-20130426/844_1 /TAXON_ID=38269 /ORGANISM="Gloeochaete witrockiana, Strain SAG 46.84" /LENGTH=286 /DNA_ID=CAMNT_0027072391 /DNA_START=40 /DNA_END=900 /DNA_ORIENTATION=+
MSYGMMDGTYFVPRGELLQWLNTTFKVSYSKVEQCANGAIHCQIMDSIYPGKVPLSKVNFNAKLEHEFIKNYKVLQSVFEQQKIDKYIEVDKLIKAKYQDNLEFLQWMKRFWDAHFNQNSDYDALARRNQKAPPAGSGVSTPPASNGVAAAAATKKMQAPAAAKPKAEKPAEAAHKASVKVDLPSHSDDSSSASLSSNSKVSQLNEQLAELRLTVDGLEKERDFYFGKLREIEILCQTTSSKDPELVSAVQKILYATEDDFVAQEEVAASDSPPHTPAIDQGDDDT